MTARLELRESQLRALPKWTEGLLPVDMDGAALLLGVSRRFLIDEIKIHPHYERPA